MRTPNDPHLFKVPGSIRGCTAKLRYVSMEDARSGAKAMHKKTKVKFSVYRCRNCGGIHVGTHNFRYDLKPIRIIGGEVIALA